jgi:dipeptidyl aminopeptidase/acylaminoacyl peptidase
MMLSRILLSAYLCAGIAGAAQLPGGPKGWTPELMMQVRRLGDVQPSPDGKRVLFTVTESVMDGDKSEYLTQIHLAENGTTRPLTSGEKSASRPKWSKDGKSVAFLRVYQGRQQIHVLPLNGGAVEPITETTGSIGAFEWSPDGRKMAFTVTEADEKKAKEKEGAKWVGEVASFSRLNVIPMDKDVQGRREGRSLMVPCCHVDAIDWSPDGNLIAYSSQKTSRRDDWPSKQIHVVDSSSGKLLVGPYPGSDDGRLRFSPDGKWVASTMAPEGPLRVSHRRLCLIPVQGGPVKILPETPNGRPDFLGWSADGRSLIFSDAKGTKTGIYLMRIEDGALVELDAGPGFASGLRLDPQGRYLGFAFQTSDHPVEAYSTPLASFRPVKVSAVNAGIPELPLGRTELVRWKGPQGLDIEGLLTYPVNYQKGQRVPLLLNVHGGPADAFTQSFIAEASEYPIAAFAAKGMAILRPNPRGSSGYGADFRAAVVGDWGGYDFQDLMAGVDKVIEMGVADPENLGIMGWSYGGYMSGWAITQTRRFKAASVGAGISDLVSLLGCTDYPTFVLEYVGGQIWEKRDLYIQRSPVFQLKGVNTPTLIQHCEGDPRVPICQGFELFNALKRLDVPVRMLAIPRQAHHATEPKALLKVMQTNLDWFSEKLLEVEILQEWL